MHRTRLRLLRSLPLATLCGVVLVCTAPVAGASTARASSMVTPARAEVLAAQPVSTHIKLASIFACPYVVFTGKLWIRDEPNTSSPTASCSSPMALTSWRNCNKPQLGSR